MSEPRPFRRPDAEPSAAERAGRAGANGSDAAIPASRQAVGVQLKSLFAELTSGPMPDHLLNLVDQLEEQCQTVGDQPEVRREGAGG